MTAPSLLQEWYSQTSLRHQARLSGVHPPVSQPAYRVCLDDDSFVAQAEYIPRKRDQYPQHPFECLARSAPLCGPVVKMGSSAIERSRNDAVSGQLSQPACKVVV